jgi:DNA-binding transcriptional LysR family regulator
VSRQIAGLEEHYRARLIHRNTRHLVLTEDGQTLLRHAQAITERVDEAEEAMRDRQGEVAGLVRMQVPNLLAMWLSDRLGSLMARYAGLQLEIVPGDANPHNDLTGFDLVVSSDEVAGGQSMIGRRLGEVQRVVVATPAYVARVGAPVRPSQLAGLDCVTYAHSGGARRQSWAFIGPDGEREEVEIEGRIHLGSVDLARHAILQGVGVAVLPWPLVAPDVRTGLLISVIEGWHAPDAVLYAAYPSRRHFATRTRVVLEFLADQVSAHSKQPLARAGAAA